MAAVPGPGSVRTLVDRHPSPSAGTASRTVRSRPVDPSVLVRGICPYVETDEGWRSAAADRAHRCLAVAPGARLAMRKQRRLCLAPAHRSCATYIAATAATDEFRGGAVRGTAVVSGEHDELRGYTGPCLAPRRRPVTRTHLTVLDAGRGSLNLPRLAPKRATAPAAVLVIALLAFAGLVITDTFSTDAAVARRGSMSDVAPSLDWTAISVESTAPSGAASAAAVATLRPTRATSTPPPQYTIRPGDTLAAIATRFGTTVKALRAANHIKDPSRLQIGRQLVVP